MEKQIKYEKLKFYYVDENYANFLRQNYDPRVPNITSKEYKNKKFFIGILMKVNGFDYLAPVSSNTQESALAFNIMNKDGKIISTIRLNYMFPVINGAYDMVQFNKLKSKYYKYLLHEEWVYCNKHSFGICELAKSIYDNKTLYNYSSINERKMYEAMCCDFKHLEQGAMAYWDRKSKLSLKREKILIDKIPA